MKSENKFMTLRRNDFHEVDQGCEQKFTVETEESSWPRLQVTDLSDYVHGNELNESTLKKMSVPQGPGSAFRFMENGFIPDGSTCFTPAF